ncbi:uncharacterized protein LOC129946435 [Eupeodes corollae]|uniref:uncharacterized protein LOC129946435 n=1 Tax=Eupeodes corollae TaxID=290404 RepID=UPI0024912420|nr:uncharacterized protein LOC129946435 [Eupeodes corollae]
MPGKRSGRTNEYELVVFLYWMASGCSYQLAGGFIGMSRYTVKSIAHKMLNFFCGSMCHLIKHVQPNNYEDIGYKFCRRSKPNIFQNVIGAIDGTHIRILCPVRKHDEYLNYKRFYSIQCQSVVDSKLMFNDAFVGFPGSVHDTRVLKNSQLYKSGNYPKQPYYLLGDSGYACRLHPIPIITPYKTSNSNEKKFNTTHSKARNVVECAFGIMKSRWRNIFNKGLVI